MRYLVGWILGVGFGATLTGAIFVTPPVAVVAAATLIFAFIVFCAFEAEKFTNEK